MPAKPILADTNPVPTLVRVKFGIVRGALWCLAKCTSLTGLYIFGQAFGTCEWLINFKRRRRFHRRMEEMLATDYDPVAMRAACRKYFTRSRCDKLYYLIFDLLPRQTLLQRIHFPQRAIIDASLTRGKGVYIAMSHHGAQHVAALIMASLGYEIAGVRDRNESALRRFIQQRFAIKHLHTAPLTMFFADAFPRDLFRWFRLNRLLGSALDTERSQSPHLKRLPVRLFGETREFLTGTVEIAQRCGAAIHQGFIISKPWFHYEMIVSPPLVDPDARGDSQEVVQQIMQEYAGNIEAHVRRYPDHISRL